jgi:hypothetical protein
MGFEAQVDLALAAWADRHGVEISSLPMEWNREDGEVRHIAIRDESGRTANFLLSWENGSHDIVIEASDLVHRRPQRIHTTKVPIEKLQRVLDKKFALVGLGRDRKA